MVELNVDLTEKVRDRESDPWRGKVRDTDTGNMREARDRERKQETERGSTRERSCIIWYIASSLSSYRGSQ